MTIQVKIALDPVVKMLDPNDCLAAWLDQCEEDGTYDAESGEDAPPIPDDFVLERFQQDLDEGTVDVAELFAESAVSIERV